MDSKLIEKELNEVRNRIEKILGELTCITCEDLGDDPESRKMEAVIEHAEGFLRLAKRTLVQGRPVLSFYIKTSGGYVTSMGDHRMAYWEAGKGAKDFCDPYHAMDVAVGLGLNGYPSSVEMMITPDEAPMNP